MVWCVSPTMNNNTGQFQAIIERLDSIETSTKQTKGKVDKIERFLVGDPLDPETPLGLADRLDAADQRLKQVESTHKAVKRWAGVAAVSAIGTFCTVAVEWIKNGLPHKP